MLTDKEKLEEELKLLDESLSLDVITKEEYDEAKQRIDLKLQSSDIKKETKTIESTEGQDEKEEEKHTTEGQQ